MVKHADAKEELAHKKKKQSKGNAFVALLIILLGLCVLLYPVISTQWNNYAQLKAADEYSKLEKSTPPEVLDTAWNAAQAYNAERLVSDRVLDAWNDTTDENSPAYQRYRSYLSQLAETDAMGRILIPSIGSDLPIYHGTGERSLSRGVGHLYGTDLPVGGVDRHSVLSAHTGLQNATLWDNLNKVKEGDAFYIAAAGHKLKYQVDHISVVLPEETDALQRVEGQDLITLVTCTPYGINTHRLLVQGHQVPMDPQEEKVFEEGSGMNMQWWMWAILAAAVLTIVLLIAWWRKNFSK
ncbi:MULTISPECIES: class C sortase [Corynebacterium]|uniref:Sortase A n=1 Tax=Corynebacterium ramonii TaxID=3026968 RepID=A0ABM5RU48_9CORY|nr:MULTISPECIES: class C sortase [Corynebacterium]AIU33519.1 Sortase A [Corynebacterium ramonii FRC0011]ESU57316.1 fimbrial protein [Corynebacterium ulcerans NCTC 12077]STC81639.1 putative fimbrial associated sortase [Corynebacterium ulcerans]